MTILPPATTAPGTYVSISTAPPPQGAAPATGAFFVAGLTLRGPVGTAVPLQSMSDYANYLGTRQTYSSMYDALDAFFMEGGTQAYVTRVVGPAATTAAHTLADRAGSPQSTLVVNANGPGLWGNSLQIAVIAGPISGTFQLQVTFAGAVVETSPPLVTPVDAVNWGTFNPGPTGVGTSSKYLTITNAGSTTAAPNNQPALISATALTGGADDNTNAGDTQFNAALTAFLANLGPGQVAAPGIVTNATYANLLNHAAANNRVALLDMTNGATASTTTTATTTTQSTATDPSYGTLVGPWLQYPGIPTGTLTPAYPRVVPPCGPAAALMSANDASHDCNNPAAGANGVLKQCLGVVQTFSTADEATLNNAGVSLFVSNSLGIALYGYTSLAIDPRWTDLANVRFRMQLTYLAHKVGDGFVFSQIDGQGHIFQAFNGGLVGMLSPFWSAGSLYGATAPQAFQVNTSSSVNTPQTIANRQINAAISVRMSPSAEFVDISITKFLAGQQLPQAPATTTNNTASIGS